MTVNGYSQDEIDAKLAAMESRWDARIGAVADKLDMFLSASDERWRRIGQRLDVVAERLDAMHAGAGATLRAVEGLRWWFVGTTVASTVVVLVGVAALNARLMSEVLGSRLGECDTVAAINQTTEQLKLTQAQLADILQQLKQRPAPEPPRHSPGKG